MPVGIAWNTAQQYAADKFCPAMAFRINLTPGAAEDLDYFDAYAQRIIMSAIRIYLMRDANVQTKRRKQPGSNPIAPWELRSDKYRIFSSLMTRLTYLQLDTKSTTSYLFVAGK